MQLLLMNTMNQIILKLSWQVNGAYVYSIDGHGIIEKFFMEKFISMSIQCKWNKDGDIVAIFRENNTIKYSTVNRIKYFTSNYGIDASACSIKWRWKRLGFSL